MDKGLEFTTLVLARVPTSKWLQFKKRNRLQQAFASSIAHRVRHFLRIPELITAWVESRRVVATRDMERDGRRFPFYLPTAESCDGARKKQCDDYYGAKEERRIGGKHGGWAAYVLEKAITQQMDKRIRRFFPPGFFLPGWLAGEELV